MALVDDDHLQRLAVYHPDHKDWIQQLPAVVEDCMRRWKLTPGRTFRPGGDSSWAALVNRVDGSPAALKVALPDTTVRNSVAVLESLAGRGAVRVLDHHPEQHALLLELCEPGTPAADRSPAETDSIAADVLPHFWDLPLEPFPELPELHQVAGEQAEIMHGRADHFGDHILQDAAELFATLAADSPNQLVLHGDANQRNVILSRRGWLAIDPRPMIGDPCYDIAGWVSNRLDDVDDPVAAVGALARRMDLDAGRTLGWTAAQTALLCSWLHRSGETESLANYRSAVASLLAALG